MGQVHRLIPRGSLECEWHQKFVLSEARGQRVIPLPLSLLAGELGRAVTVQGSCKL